MQEIHIPTEVQYLVSLAEACMIGSVTVTPHPSGLTWTHMTLARGDKYRAAEHRLSGEKLKSLNAEIQSLGEQRIDGENNRYELKLTDSIVRGIVQVSRYGRVKTGTKGTRASFAKKYEPNRSNKEFKNSIHA